MNDATFHTLLSAALSAIGVIAGWNLLTLIRLDKSVTVLEKGAISGDRDQRLERLESKVDHLSDMVTDLRERVAAWSKRE